MAQKVTITLKPEVLERVDRSRHKSQMTRSGFVAQAIDAYLASVAEQELENQWAQSYLAEPLRVSADALELLDAPGGEEW